MMEWFDERFSPGPLFGWLCIVFALLLPLVWFRARALRRRPSVRFSSVGTLRTLPVSWVGRTRFVLPLLRMSAIAALLIALARPQSGGSYHDRNEGIAIQMVLDVSGSMSEEDFLIDRTPARRLDAVKRVFRDFVLGGDSLRGRDGDLIGMTTFAMYADTSCPLTLDHGSLADLLAQAEIPGWVNGRQKWQNQEANHTALGDAIALATDDLRRAGEQAVAGVPGAVAAKSRVMILLTDGANNPAEMPGTTPPDPREAAKVAARLGIKIYTIGAVGALRGNRGRAGFFGQRRAQVDEPLMQAIADTTGGKYFRATDTDSLLTVYDEIDRLERRRTGERSFHDNIQAAKVAMLCALGLLLAELVLVNTRYRTIP